MHRMIVLVAVQTSWWVGLRGHGVHNLRWKREEIPPCSFEWCPFALNKCTNVTAPLPISSTSLQTLMSLELGLQTLHSSSAYLCILPSILLQMSRTRFSLDLRQKGGFDEPKIAKNGQMEHAEHTKTPLMMRGQNERDDNLCTSASKTHAWHFCMMHATPHKVMAPKMPQCGPV